MSAPHLRLVRGDLPGKSSTGPHHPTACVGDGEQPQTGQPTRDAGAITARARWAIRTTPVRNSCGHPGPALDVLHQGARRRLCPQCMWALNEEPGGCYVEPDPDGGDAA